MEETKEEYGYLLNKMSKKLKKFPSFKSFETTSNFVTSMRKSVNNEINDSIATITPNNDNNLTKDKRKERPKSSYTRLFTRPASAITTKMKNSIKENEVESDGDLDSNPFRSV